MTPTLEAFLEAMGMELAPQINAAAQGNQAGSDKNAVEDVAPSRRNLPNTSGPASAAPFLPAEAVSELCL